MREKCVEYKGLSYWNKYELQLYHLIGVNRFCKVILWFEKIKRFRNNRKNENYHLSDFSIFALERYTGFLLYNAIIHIVSLFFAGICLLLTLSFEVHSLIVDVIMGILFFLNIYCIILQRTNYLKIKEYCYRYYKSFCCKSNLCNKGMVQRHYIENPQQFQDDCKVLFRIKNAFIGQADCVLNVSDIESLKRICEYTKSTSHKKTKQKIERIEEARLIDKCSSISGPYTILQMRADRLQRRLGVSGRKILSYTAIITENTECEILYKRLVPEDTAHNMCFICSLLYEISLSIGNIAKKNET